MDDLPVPALPWSQNTRVLSTVLLIHVVISLRISFRVPSKQIFRVSIPAPLTYGMLFKSESSTVLCVCQQVKFSVQRILPRASRSLMPSQIRCTTTKVSPAALLRNCCMSSSKTLLYLRTRASVSEIKFLSSLVPCIKEMNACDSEILTQLTEILILRVFSNEIRTLQRLITYTLDHGLHGLNIPKIFFHEKSIHLIHLRKERANGFVTSCLVDNHLINIDHQIALLVNVRWAEPLQQQRGSSMLLGHKGGSR